MKVINQHFQVNYHYPVIFTQHIFQPDNYSLCDFLSQYDSGHEDEKILFVLDGGMLKHYPELKEEIKIYIQSKTTLKLVPFITIPGGEEVKNCSSYYDAIVSSINECKIDRHSIVVAVGGGAVLDLTGYAAATAHRGIRHIRIPTTVLSQNDSGVGVKNGVNYFSKKNFLGTFTQPYAVFNDIYFLNTLDDRNWRSGLAEAVKVGLIKDANFFEWMEAHADDLAHRDMEAIEYLIYRCAELHLQHISSGDPFEIGSSRPLDFGHWSAHKLEQMSGFAVLHGEAVAIGMALDSLYSEKTGRLTTAAAQRILSLLQSLQFNIYHPLLEEDEVINGLEEFREHLGGALTIMLLKDIGRGENTNVMDTGMIRQCIIALKKHERPGIN